MPVFLLLWACWGEPTVEAPSPEAQAEAIRSRGYVDVRVEKGHIWLEGAELDDVEPIAGPYPQLSYGLDTLATSGLDRATPVRVTAQVDQVDYDVVLNVLYSAGLSGFSKYELAQTLPDGTLQVVPFEPRPSEPSAGRSKMLEMIEAGEAKWAPEVTPPSP